MATPQAVATPAPENYEAPSSGLAAAGWNAEEKRSDRARERSSSANYSADNPDR